MYVTDFSGTSTHCGITFDPIITESVANGCDVYEEAR